MDQAAHLREKLETVAQKYDKLTMSQMLDHGEAGAGPRVISVTSGKGGVGKTNIVGNLGIAYQRMNKKVLIFDADLGLANIDIIFGLSPQHSIDEVINGEKELAQVIVEGPEGVSIIPASSGIQEMANLSEGQKINLLNEFDMLNRHFDILLIDTGAGISPNVTYFNLAAQERIIVVTPEPTSITDAYALIKVMYTNHGTNQFHLLVNMAKNEAEAKSVCKHLCAVVDRFLAGVALDYAGYIPWDKYLHHAVRRREPVICCYPGADSSRSFRNLARYGLPGQPGNTHDGNIKFFMKQLLTPSVC